MNRIAHVSGLVPMLLLSAIGCIDMGKTVPTPTVVAQPTLICTPDSGYIGEAFALTGETFEVPASNNVLVFSGNVETRADSGTPSVIYASVPFGAISGPIEVRTNGHTYTSEPFRVREVYNPTSLNTVWYNLTPPITAKDSSAIDHRGIRRTWQATIRHDTLHIRRIHSFPEAYAEYHLLFRHRGSNTLPQLMTSWVFFEDDTHQRTWDTLFVGIMKVQNWDTTVALSGKFITKPFSWGPFTFWVSPHNIETASPGRMLMRDE